jgi:amino acid transporter
MLLRTIQAVLWSFLGIRKTSEYQKDVDELNPLVVIATGIVMALVFVVTLIVLVHWIV